MLDKIPDEFWKSPKKVFEQFCGKGGFLIDIIDRFMKHINIDNNKDNIILDKDGRYGCTCHTIGIKIDNKENNHYYSLLSKKFKKIVDSCSWSNYQIDWRLFTYLKKDFWK